MKQSSPKPLGSLKLASAGLASALTLIVLGASTPRLSAGQTNNFNNQSDSPFTRYQIPASAGYGTPSYTFPTNAAGPGNYGYRILQPPIANDSGNYLMARAGAIWQGADAIYGEDNLGRYSVGVDLLAWNGSWINQLAGVGSYMTNTSFANISTIIGGWSMSGFTLAVAALNGINNGTPAYDLWGTTKFGETVLNPTRQYRFELSSWNAGGNFGEGFHMVQLFDKGNTNTAWQSAMGVDVGGNFFLRSGYCGLLVVNVQAPPNPVIPWPYGQNSTEGADATFDNYSAYSPLLDQTPSTTPPVVCDTYPPPCGNAPDFNPTILAAIVNQEYQVISNTIHLYLDGVQIPDGSLNIEFGTGDIAAPYYGDGKGVHKFNPLSSSWPTVFPGATITYQIPDRLPNLSVHTNTVVFRDDQPAWHTNSWTWTSAWPYLYASNSLPLGSASMAGFSTRTVWAPWAHMGGFPGIVNCVAGAQMLLNNVSCPVNLRATNWVQKVAWTMAATEGGGITNYPGLCPTNGNYQSMAIQAQAYLQLAAGTNKFHVSSDDSFGIFSGANVTDTSVVMFQSPGDSGADADFYVIAEAAGLYPVNIFYQNGNNGGHCYLYSYDSGGVQRLVNDVANGGVPAFYPVPSSVLSSPSLVAAATTSLTNAYWNPTNWNLMSSTVVRSNSNYSTPVATTLKTALFPTVTAVPPGNVVPTSASGPSCAGDLVVTDWSLSGSVSMSGIGTNTVTCAVPSSATFYRLYGPGSQQILSCQKSNANLVITYKWQR